MVKKIIAKGEEMKACTFKDSSKLAIESAEKEEGSIVCASEAFFKDSKLKNIETTKLIRPLSIVSKADADEKLLKVIEAFKKAAK